MLYTRRRVYLKEIKLFHDTVSQTFPPSIFAQIARQKVSLPPSHALRVQTRLFQASKAI